MKYHSGQDFFRFHNLIRPVAGSLGSDQGKPGPDHPGLLEPGTTIGDKNKMSHKYTTDPTNAAPAVLVPNRWIIFSELLILDHGFLLRQKQ